MFASGGTRRGETPPRSSHVGCALPSFHGSTVKPVDVRRRAEVPPSRVRRTPQPLASNPPGEALAFVNIEERQVLPSAPRLSRVRYRPPADAPDLVRMISRP
jgi:hypothetical protein